MSLLFIMTAKMQNLIEKYKVEIEENLDEIKTAVEKHQKKLIAAVSGIENGRKETVSMPQQVSNPEQRSI